MAKRGDRYTKPVDGEADFIQGGFTNNGKPLRGFVPTKPKPSPKRRGK